MKVDITDRGFCYSSVHTSDSLCVQLPLIKIPKMLVELYPCSDYGFFLRSKIRIEGTAIQIQTEVSRDQYEVFLFSGNE